MKYAKSDFQHMLELLEANWDELEEPTQPKDANTFVFSKIEWLPEENQFVARLSWVDSFGIFHHEIANVYADTLDEIRTRLFELDVHLEFNT